MVLAIGLLVAFFPLTSRGVELREYAKNLAATNGALPASAVNPAGNLNSASAPASTPVLMALSSKGPETAPIPESNPCVVRDPEDGACYLSADAADRAWLSRGSKGSPMVITINGTHSGEEEADDDEEDSEDGGQMAPDDSLLPRPLLRTTSLELRNPARRSFWKNLARTVKGLVVRKADSRPVSVSEDDVASLFQTDFPLPIEQFPSGKFRDSFNARRGRHRRHHAIDLPAPRGTPVVAVVDGTIERLGRDAKGGNVCYLRDESGRFTYYYAHLSKHEEGLRAGDKVKRGQHLGEVGSTGHSTGPHLHFAIFRDVEGETAWRSLVVNPYLIFSGIGR